MIYALGATFVKHVSALLSLIPLDRLPSPHGHSTRLIPIPSLHLTWYLVSHGLLCHGGNLFR